MNQGIHQEAPYSPQEPRHGTQQTCQDPSPRPAQKTYQRRPQDRDDEALLTELEVCRRLQITVAKLRKWRETNRGPLFNKFGSTIVYREDDVDTFWEWYSFFAHPDPQKLKMLEKMDRLSRHGNLLCLERAHQSVITSHAAFFCNRLIEERWPLVEFSKLHTTPRPHLTYRKQFRKEQEESE